MPLSLRSMRISLSGETAASSSTDGSSDIITLLFSKNSVFNTVISSSDNEVMYDVVTPKKLYNKATIVHRLDRGSGERRFAGEIVWKPLGDWQVRMGWQHCEWVPVRKWLKSAHGYASSGKTFTGAGGTRYQWKKRGFRFHLVKEGNSKTLAVFNQARRDILFRVVEPPSLEVSPEVLQSIDFIIVSLLIVEKSARDG